MRSILFAFFAFTLFASFQTDEKEPIKDYLGIGETLTFNENQFHLAWSANPSANYYKQEYLLDSTSLEDYNEMLIVEAVNGQTTPEIAVEMKLDELAQLKVNNPVINWNVYKNKDEIILDFVITDNATVYEWNLYRYSTLKDTKKGKHLVLCAYSYKDILYTNADLKPFFNRILENRDDYISKLGELVLPKLRITEE